MKREFHQILREKIHRVEDTKCSRRSSIMESPDPLHLAFLMGQVEKTFIPHPPKSHSYLQPTNLSTQAKASSVELPLPPLPPRNFNFQQKEAWLWFWKRGAPLNERFTRHELQKQFRKLAQVLHPDKNTHPKASESFIQLREHYRNLGLLLV